MNERSGGAIGDGEDPTVTGVTKEFQRIAWIVAAMYRWSIAGPRTSTTRSDALAAVVESTLAYMHPPSASKATENLCVALANLLKTIHCFPRSFKSKQPTAE